MMFDTEQVDVEAIALAELGLKERAAIEILKEGATVEEAANRLLDEAHPPPSVLDSVTDYISKSFVGACATRVRPEVYRPGPYIIVELGAPIKMTPSAASQASDIDVGSRIELTQIEVNHSQHLVLGLLQDGRWLGIASLTDDDVWA